MSSTVLSAIRNPRRIWKKMKHPKTYSITGDGFHPYVDRKQMKKISRTDEEEEEEEKGKPP